MAAAVPRSSCSHRSALLALAALVVMAYTFTFVQLQPALTIAATQSTLRHASAMHTQHEQHETSARTDPVALARETTTAKPVAPVNPSPEEIRRKKREKLVQRCFLERDYGMVPLIQKAQRTYCNDPSRVDPALGNLSTYIHYDSRHAGLRSTVVTNLWVDLRNAQVFKQIQNVSQDGHLHDPRLQHASVDSYCVCETTQDQNIDNAVRVWELLHGDHPLDKGSEWQFCRAINSTDQLNALRSGISATPWKKTAIRSISGREEEENEEEREGAKEEGEEAPEAEEEETKTISATAPPNASGYPFPVHYIKQNAIIIGRRDDHNPFFQIAVALNAWIMMKVLDWSPQNTQLVYFDDGFPAITDEVQRRILAPLHPVVLGKEILGSVVHFERAMVAPFEYSGPLMRHLDNNEPCARNQLIQDFRNLVMTKFGVDMAKQDPTTCTITVISRKPYAGRMVQRKWLNEDAILERMRVDYGASSGFYRYGTCRLQAYDFVGLSLDEQMRIVVESDVVIGMHGAGMANVLWARPETYVAEIFPLKRKRYGYRNICRFVGCKWFEFRGGVDTGTGDNASDKIISYADWFQFMDPIMRKAIATLEARVAGTLRRSLEAIDDY